LVELKSQIIDRIHELDTGNMYSTLKNFYAQVENAVNIIDSYTINRDIEKDDIDNILITGLGGSAIGGDLLRSYIIRECKVPVIINRNYDLPDFVRENTLVLISSYSGNTEETISAYNDAIRKKAVIMCVTTGGKIEKIALANNHILIKIPGGLQPRCAIGYSFFVLLGIFVKLGFIKEKTKDIISTINVLKNASGKYSNIACVESDTAPDKESQDAKQNLALNIATKLKGKLPIIYSSVDYFDVVNLRWRGQLAENSKVLAYGNLFPEMNHNELVGWKCNKEILKNTIVIFIADCEDNNRIIRRMVTSSEIMEKYCSEIITLMSNANSRLARIFEMIYLGDWVSYYLAILNSINPTPVDVIDYLKEKLKNDS